MTDHRRAVHPEVPRPPVRTHLDLLLTFLSTDIERLYILQTKSILKEQRTFTNARLSCYKYNAAGYNTTTQYPVELGIRTNDPFFIRTHYFTQGHRPNLFFIRRKFFPFRLSQLVVLRNDFFDKSVPLITGRTLT